MEQLAPLALPLVGDAGRYHAFHGKPRLPGVAPGRKRLVSRPQEARLREPPLRLGQHNIGRNQPLVSRLGPFEERHHRPHAREDIPAALRPRRLHHVGGGLMAVVAMGHAADDGILVGLFGQQRHQFADPDAVHVRGDRLVQRTAIIVAGFRFRVQRIQVWGAAPHPNLDNRLGFGLGGRGCGQGAQTQVMAQHQPGSAEQGPLNRLAPRHRGAAHACNLFVGQRIEVCGTRTVWCAHIVALCFGLKCLLMPVEKLRAVD